MTYKSVSKQQNYFIQYIVTIYKITYLSQKETTFIFYYHNTINVSFFI